MAAMSKFGFLVRPKWIGFHLLCAVAVLGMIAAGFWQLRRLDERKTDNAAFVAQIEQDAVPIAELLPAIENDPESVVNRRVIVTGTYSNEQAVLFNRSQGGSAVDNVLTPLNIEGTSAVLLVNRGAIGVNEPPPAPFPGTVTIEGRLRPSESRVRGSLTDADQEVVTEVRRVELDKLTPLAGDGELLPMFAELRASDPEVGIGDPGLLDPPSLSEGNHLSYAVQWFIFSAAVALGWVLAINRSLGTRRKAAAKAQSKAAAQDGPVPETIDSPVS